LQRLLVECVSEGVGGGIAHTPERADEDACASFEKWDRQTFYIAPARGEQVIRDLIDSCARRNR
jgi:hypothetical protein